MKATEAKLLDFLKKSPQFVIPIYQRTYSWTEKECQQLWNDILQTGKKKDIFAYFIGSIVYIEKGLYHVSSQSSLLVIDGQQRLTTVCLILEALARQIGDTEPLDGFSAKKLRNYYLLNPLEEKELHYKLLLTKTDKESLLALFDQKDLPKNHSIKIKENFEFFKKKIKELGSDIKFLCEGLAKLIIVDIALNRDQDNPQLIFESMNSTGKELSQADLIRNFILMGLEQNHQENLYKNYWRPMEFAFGQAAYSEHFDFFMRDYLTLKTGEIPNIKKVYEVFKNYTHRSKKSMEDLVKDLKVFSNYYCSIALNQEENKALKEAFSDLKELKVSVSYPFLLKVYHDYKNGLLNVRDFESVVRFIENYVFRRAICNISTNSMNKTFAKFSQAIRKEAYLESIKADFLLQSSYRRFPKNDEFLREIQIRDLYNFRRGSYWLRKLENYDRKERIDVNDYSIEHILPQNENLSQEWRQALGENWKEIQEKYLHTLGNLTLTGYNSEYKDHFFTKKKEIKGGFKESPLRLNKGLKELETWNENTIEERAKQMAQKAVNVWFAPSLSPEILDKYRPPKQKKSEYTIENYEHLSKKDMKKLFEAFQKEVLALDLCVTEKFLKSYIAYKAEGNFVCVKPQARGLSLSLGLKMQELHDPKGIAKDISNIGRAGTGDVEVVLSSEVELRYIIGLVRQALEKQISNDIE
ncbi:MAG: DUF262 domain-containing protein [Bdellovibrionales bacterium]|nr:DUF262 domain-containing protein [Bdellovibrionales bacterium]